MVQVNRVQSLRFRLRSRTEKESNSSKLLRKQKENFVRKMLIHSWKKESQVLKEKMTTLSIRNIYQK